MIPSLTLSVPRVDGLQASAHRRQSLFHPQVIKTQLVAKPAVVFTTNYANVFIVPTRSNVSILKRKVSSRPNASLDQFCTQTPRSKFFSCRLSHCPLGLCSAKLAYWNVGKWEIVQSYFPLYKCYIRITWSDIDVSQVKVRRTNDRRRIRRNRSSQFRGPLPVGRTGETVQIIPSGKLNVHVVLVADVALFKNLLSGRSR